MKTAVMLMAYERDGRGVDPAIKCGEKKSKNYPCPRVPEGYTAIKAGTTVNFYSVELLQIYKFVIPSVAEGYVVSMSN